MHHYHWSVNVCTMLRNINTTHLEGVCSICMFNIVTAREYMIVDEDPCLRLSYTKRRPPRRKRQDNLPRTRRRLTHTLAARSDVAKRCGLVHDAVRERNCAHILDRRSRPSDSFVLTRPRSRSFLSLAKSRVVRSFIGVEYPRSRYVRPILSVSYDGLWLPELARIVAAFSQATRAAAVSGPQDLTGG